MKDDDVLAGLVGGTHARVIRVDLCDEDLAPIKTDLPVTGGAVSASAVDPDRWSASLDIAGTLWTPLDPGDPLSGFARTVLRVYAGATAGTLERTLELCRLTVVEARTRRTGDGAVDTTVVAVGPAGYMDTAELSFDASAYASPHAAIEAVVALVDPPSWSGIVDDDTGSAGAPSTYTADNRPAWQIVEDLAAEANIVAVFESDGTLYLRRPMDSHVDRFDTTLAVGDGGNVVGYDVETGRGRGFANHVRVEIERGNGDTVTGDAVELSGPLGVNSAGRVSTVTRYTGTASQAAAVARAASMLPAALRAWETIIVDMVPHPLLEPDDHVVVALDDRTVYAQVTRVDFPLALDSPATVGLRILPAGTYTPPPEPPAPGLPPTPSPAYPSTTRYPSTTAYPATG